MYFKSIDQTYKKTQNQKSFSTIQKLQSFVSKSKEVIASGSTLSYAPLSANLRGVSISMLEFNDILGIDYEKNIIEVEAGIRLLELYNFLLQKKLHLKIQPGHPEITIGACIATNIHGKNNIKDGNFSEIVLEITLMIYDGSIITANRKINPEFFEATIGGFGLTGIIISAKLKMDKIQSEFILQKTESIVDVNELPIHLKNSSYKSEYAYAFINICNASDKEWGMSLSYSGNFANELKNKTSSRIKCNQNLYCIKNNQIYIPILNNPFFSSAINYLYYVKENTIKQKIIPLKNVLFPILGKEYYFKSFGKSGFIEVQNLIPSNVFPEYMLSLRILQRKYNVYISLTGMKVFESAREGISFGGNGISLSLDIPLNPSNLKFLDSLDKLNIDTSTITNIAKDSRLSSCTFDKQFTCAQTFKKKIAKLDPYLKFKSELSKRLLLK